MMIRLIGMHILFISAASLSCSPGSSEESDAGTEMETDGNPKLIDIIDLNYVGAFRVPSDDFGMSSTNYAVGTLAYNPQNHSLFIAGHAQHNGVAEFPIPDPGSQEQVQDLPVAGVPLQSFVAVLDTGGNPEGLDRITGMLWKDGALIINAEQWYDAAGDNSDTTLVVVDADDIAGARKGYFELSGAAHSAGYMGPIPPAWQSPFGAQYFTGWSSVYSITSRYSQGPSLWTFEPDDLIHGDPSQPAVSAIARMNYAYGDSHMSDGALDWAEQGETGPFTPADPVWNPLSEGMYAFFVPGTQTFAVIGSTGGLKTGIGYKAVQEDGSVCGGPCPYGTDDTYNYYWLFDVSEILSASKVSDPRPYAHGIWELPFDNGGQHHIIGATLDPAGNTLYIALGNAGQVGDYDRPPLILVYQLS